MPRRPPRPCRSELPNVADTLRNYAAVIGKEPPFPKDLDLRSPHYDYDVQGLGLAEAHAIVEWGPDGGFSCNIGHYNPASREWQIFPEYVPNESQARALSIEMQYRLRPARRAAFQRAQFHGGSFVDHHDRATHEARVELERQLAPLGTREFAQSELVQQALNHPDLLQPGMASPVLGIDENTFCFPTLGTQTPLHEHVEHVGIDDTITSYELEVRPGAILALCYTGLVVQAQNGNGRIRNIRHVPVGYNDPDLGWIPEVDIVTPDQWEILRPITGTLLEMSRTIPRFSPFYCSVVYGQPGLETLQWRA